MSMNGQAPADGVSYRLLRPLSRPLTGSFSVPGDKSLSHRALMLAAMGRGVSKVRGLLDSWDVRSTYSVLRELGAGFSGSWNELQIQGWGENRHVGPLVLDCGNSGTTMRLLAGVLAAGQGEYELVGDASLSRRPMQRIVQPLRHMGAVISCSANGTAPLSIESQPRLCPINWAMPIASAQVKSCILLAGAQSAGETTVSGDAGSRDHTERLLEALGVHAQRCGGKAVSLCGPAQWDGFSMSIPGDLSSAAYLATLALLVPDSDITINGVGLNPTRLGFFRLIKRMGADVTWQERGLELGEPFGDMRVRFSALRGIDVVPEEVPGCIDELIVLAVLAASADGETSVSGAGELRRKESNRITATVGELRRLGVDICEREDGWTVKGPTAWKSGRVDTHGDHRLEMSLAVAALACSSPRETVIENAVWSGVSWPGFWECLSSWCDTGTVWAHNDCLNL
ncbi:3-phosphoshikimate 1-carboxyvinyltransferase [bacterium]|nr:3-phosphoshikimate 1-carboxyvinyltransferase [bacterium]